MEFTAQQIADLLTGTVVGNPSAKVGGFSKIEVGVPGTITFLANAKYEHHIYRTKASIVLVNNDFTPTAPIEATLIKVPNAYASLATLMQAAEDAKVKKSGIDSTACIAATATVGEDCYIGAFACIGDNATIGKGCMIYPYTCIGDNASIGDQSILYPHTTVYEGCVIGNNCIIHAGAVIGSDGFGFAHDDGKYMKIAQTGNVVIEDDVEVGANTAIDRAVLGSTVIHKGVKLDNLIQIAHNVEIGNHTAIAAQAGIAGSTKIGANCMIGGQAGFIGHIHIGDHSQIAAQSGIIGNVPDKARMMGTPAFPLNNFLRSSVLFEKLPELSKKLDRLEREIEELKKNKQTEYGETENVSV
jgi:UDP-3-O-[3-hydroxymyristoyl] glucosamine N-acyltransferase